MKKLLVSILAFLYVASSTGATVHMHYCMGRLVNLGLASEQTKCSKCASKEDNASCSKKCCKDAQKTIKSQQDQKLAENGLQLIHLTALTTPSDYLSPVDITGISSLTEQYPISHAPPLKEADKIYILHCTYRI